jgi:transglutaminase-like putative cysteine protease
MIYKVVHKTEYIYAEPASLCYNEARLLPRPVELPQLSQRCRNARIIIEPPYTDYRERTDYFGNTVIYYTIRQPHTRTVITATSEITVTPKVDGFASLLQTYAGNLPWGEVSTRLLADKEPATLEARQFVISSPMIATFPALADYAAPSFAAGRPILEAVHNLMQRIHSDLEFVPGVTSIATPLSEVLDKRRGVCQDYAHLMIGCLRSQGLAARYVSGYIETLPPPGEEKLQGADASHAWCSVFVPQLGWVDFDPTNNQLPAEQHLFLGWGRDFSDVTPLKGVFFSTGKHKLKVSVDVTRLDTT